MVKLTVTFLGTSSAAPTKTRALPSVAVQREGEVVLLDAGEGVQRQVLSSGIGLNKDMTILVSHLHGDHVSGLLGLLQTMGLSQRKKPIMVVGPPDLLKWLQVTSKLLHMGLTFPIEFRPVRTGVVVRGKWFKVKAAKATHSVEAYSYLVEENPRPGAFHPEKARRLGIPEGKLWSRLQGGKSVAFKGKMFNTAQVADPPRQGRKIGYSGDSRPSPRLARFFRGCDLLVFDSTFRGSDREKAVERKHSTCVEAAQLAKAAGARRLALTHFSARYDDVAPLVKEARKVFSDCFAAADGMKVDVDYP